MTRPDVCPLCGKPPLAGTAPFCSQGCKDRDLLNWLGEAYRMPGREGDPESETGLDSNPRY